MKKLLNPLAIIVLLLTISPFILNLEQEAVCLFLLMKVFLVILRSFYCK